MNKGFRATAAVSPTHIGVVFWNREKWKQPVGPVRAIRIKLNNDLNDILEQLHSSAFGRLPLKRLTILRNDYISQLTLGAIAGWCWYNNTEIRVDSVWKIDEGYIKPKVIKILGRQACNRPYNEFKGVIWKAVGLGLHLKGHL